MKLHPVKEKVNNPNLLPKRIREPFWIFHRFKNFFIPEAVLIKKIFNPFQATHAQNKKIIGQLGESRVADFLKKEKNYKIIARNWRYKQDEIDIVAKDAEVIVFVEVKCCTSENLVPTYYRVHKRKKIALQRACKAFMKNIKPPPKYFRFDIVTVKLCQEKKTNIEHYTNVRLFSKHFHTLNDE